MAVSHALVWSYPSEVFPVPNWAQNICIVIGDDQPNCFSVVYIDKNAFRFTDPGNLDPAEVKRIKRKTAEPLNFGDEISFLSTDVHMVRGLACVFNFQRISTRRSLPFDLRPYYSEQIAVPCAMNSSRTEIYNSFFGLIPITNQAEAARAMPNVPLRAWITMNFVNNLTSVQPVFVEFRDVMDLHEDDCYVANCPWYSPPVFRIDRQSDDETFSNDRDTSIREKEPALYIGNLKVLLTKENGKIAYFPLMSKEDPIEPGTRLIVQVIENVFYGEKLFIASVEVQKDAPKVKTMQIGTSICVACTIREEERFPGIYVSNLFGRIADLEKILGVHHLSKFKKSTCRVYVELSDIQRFSNFTIRAIDNEKKAKMIDDAARQDPICTKGIICDRFGKMIFSVEHPTIIFKYDESTCNTWTYLEAGTRVSIAASIVDFDHCIASVTELGVLSGQPKLQRIERGPLVLFRTKGAVQTSLKNGGTPLLFSEDFGVLYDRTGQLNAKRLLHPTVHVWVQHYASSPTANASSPTAFEVVWHGESYPNFEQLRPSVRTTHTETPASSKRPQRSIDLEYDEDDSKEEFLRKIKELIHLYDTHQCCLVECAEDTCPTMKFLQSAITNERHGLVIREDTALFAYCFKILNP